MFCIRGHVVYLAAARELGAALLVAVNSDSSARQLGKGPDRPLNRESDRLLVVAALESVSFVTTFDEPTPCELLQRCQPDVYVKGGDYDMETLEETRLVRSWGGRSVAIPFVDGLLDHCARATHSRRLMSRKAAFIDRDGVLNEERAFVHRHRGLRVAAGSGRGVAPAQGRRATSSW